MKQPIPQSQVTPTADTQPMTHADSLNAIAPITDSTGNSPFGFSGLNPFFSEADTLIVAPRYREATLEEVMGENATLIPEKFAPSNYRPNFTSDGLFQGLVLLLAALYAMLLYYNMADVRTLFGRIARNSTGGKLVFDEYRGSSFPQFMNTSGLIGLFFLGILTVKYSDVLISDTLTEHISTLAAMPLSVGITAVFCVMLITEWLLLQLIGLVTRSGSFIVRLLQLRQLYFTLANIVISPLLLLFVLCPPGRGGMWFFLIVIELAIMLLLYLREALGLFLAKKISILHWILYLCIVEIFPISLLWLLVTR